MDVRYAEREKDVLHALERTRLIAILRNIAPDKLRQHAAALYEGGLRFVEVTLPPEEDEKATENTVRGIERLVREWGQEMRIGAGTVCSAAQAEKVVAAGAQYLISPHVDEALVKKTIALGAVPMPGVLTPSEMVRAKAAGAPVLKVFPASVMGAAYIKAVRAPLSTLCLMAVGGVDESNLADFLRNGAYGAGVGGALCDRRAIASGDWAPIRDAARRLVNIVQAEVHPCG